MLGNPTEQPPLLVLVGPTAVGKTKLSFVLAEQYGCEIISGDSMQVYRGMDIGTAKATPEERKRIPHHLIDIRDPQEAFSVSDFQQLAREKIAEIHSRGKLPFIVGGTGLYIESVIYDFQFSEAGVDETFRRKQHEYAAVHGSGALHKRLNEIDPETADRLHPNDLRRIIRALEVHHLTGMPMSHYSAKQTKQPLYNACILGLTMERKKLYERIELRVDEMMEQGLVEEVESLLRQGCTREMVSMQGLGYKEIADYLQGDYDLTEAVRLLKQSTRRFAKRQLSWFRRMQDIHWVDLTDPQNLHGNLQTIHDIIAGKFRINEEYI